MIKKMKSRPLTKEESDKVIIRIIETLLDPFLPFSGKHRKEQWERGWEENLKSGDINPRYFGKYPVQRLNGEFVMAEEEGYEQGMLYSLVDSLAKEHLAGLPTICEFGCGTGHNLVRVKALSPDSHLIGLDWAESSQKLVEKLGFEGRNFDYFNPKGNIPENCGVFTVASLEQTGKKYKKFVQYLLKQKPRVVVHIEPIPELLNPASLIDYLSIRYMKKRRYLTGYLDYLKLLESKGKIKIHEAKRSGIGSMFIDGYSIIVWSPL